MLNRFRLYCLGGFSKTVTVAVGAAAAAGMMSGNAMAAPFTLDTTVFGGPSAALVADAFTGHYNQRLTETSPGTFAAVGYWDAGLLFNGATSLGSASTGLGAQYAMYALFSAEGTFVPAGAGDFDFAATSGFISLWADPNLDSNPKVLPAVASGAVGLVNTADDILLGAALLKTGSGHVDATDPLNKGKFTVFFNPFGLTPAGASYFISPVPFYSEFVLTEKINSLSSFSDFSILSPALNQAIEGSADAFFNPVPEPASLTLVALGLAGWARRRRAV